MSELPTGTVTFLFTDLEGSTRLWEEYPEAMKDALARHDEILRDAVEGHDGHVVKTTGDGVHAVFRAAGDAGRAAIDIQRTVAKHEWEHTGPLRLRMGVHSGEVQHRDGDYYGSAVNRAARLMAAASGGQVLVSLASEELLRDSLSDDVELRDLGEHRLRDLTRLERVFELRPHELERDFPRLRSLDAFPGNLPIQLTSFVGRDEELAAVAQALGDARLVTLTGAGGVGKTRLAIQVGAELLPDFRDGVWLCELAGAGDHSTAMHVVAEALGVAPRPGMTLEESIADFVRGRQLLVVLDNCEHVLGAASTLTQRVLQQCVESRVLATSREALAVRGEQVWPVRPLAVPDPSAAVDAVSASESVRLFADRARAARPTLAFDATTSVAVADICRRLDGIPLAIELAAARVVSMSPLDIAARLDERFRLLTGGRGVGLERHRTLRATVDWSYSLLDDQERAVFERLGVFVGGFVAEAGEAVAANDGVEAWDVIDALTGLVGKSMVALDEAADGTIRYQLLETLRQYAVERLDEQGEADTYRRRHAEHYATFAEELGIALVGPDELVWRRRFHAELDNLRTAVVWALAREDDDDAGELAVRIVAALAAESVQESVGGIANLAERTLTRADRSSPGRRTAVLGAAAWGAIRHGGDLAMGIELAKAALRDPMDPSCPAPQVPYVALGLASDYAGSDLDARALYTEARRVLDEIGASRFAHAFLQSSLAFSEASRGHRANAAREAEDALRLARDVGNPSQLATAYTVFGISTWRDDPERARRALEESAAITRAGGSGTTFGMCLSLLAQLRMADDATGALRALRDGIVDSRDRDRLQIGTVVDRSIPVFGALGYHELAAVLGGLVTSGAMVTLSSLPPEDVDDRVHALAAARSALGDDAYELASERGSTMDFDDAVGFMLVELDRLIADTEHV